MPHSCFIPFYEPLVDTVFWFGFAGGIMKMQLISCKSAAVSTHSGGRLPRCPTTIRRPEVVRAAKGMPRGRPCDVPRHWAEHRNHAGLHEIGVATDRRPERVFSAAVTSITSCHSAKRSPPAPRPQPNPSTPLVPDTERNTTPMELPASVSGGSPLRIPGRFRTRLAPVYRERTGSE